jgi:hypothetical protein
MSTTSVLPASSVARVAPAIRLATTVRERFRRAAVALWTSLEACGNARALRELRSLHDRWEFSDPARARHVRDAIAFIAKTPRPK